MNTNDAGLLSRFDNRMELFPEFALFGELPPQAVQGSEPLGLLQHSVALFLIRQLVSRKTSDARKLRVMLLGYRLWRGLREAGRDRTDDLVVHEDDSDRPATRQEGCLKPFVNTLDIKQSPMRTEAELTLGVFLGSPSGERLF